MFWRAPPYLLTQRLISTCCVHCVQMKRALRCQPELNVEYRSLCEIWHTLNVEDLLDLSPALYNGVYRLRVDIQLWKRRSRTETCMTLEYTYSSSGKYPHPFMLYTLLWGIHDIFSGMKRQEDWRREVQIALYLADSDACVKHQCFLCSRVGQSSLDPEAALKWKGYESWARPDWSPTQRSWGTE